MSRTNKITSHEIAQKVGVSRATVSRAFNPQSIINEATRSKVLDMAKKFKYRPNAIARSLVTKQSHLIAVVVNNLCNLYEAELIDLYTKHLQNKGLHPIIVSVDNMQNKLANLVSISAYQVDAVVVFADNVTPQIAKQCFYVNSPIMVDSVGISDNDLEVDQIILQDDLAFEELVKLLISTGSNGIAYLNGNPSQPNTMRRAKLVEILKKHKMRFKAEGNGDFTYDSGYRETLMLLRGSHGIDTIICANDEMALGAIDAIRYTLKLRIPQDINIVGFDDIRMAAWPNYDLTTIQTPTEELVNMIDSLVTNRIKTPDVVPTTAYIKNRLITRSTTK